MVDKLILPAEVKVCATCSYWDGERRDDIRKECGCIWEDLEPDSAAQGKVA